MAGSQTQQQSGSHKAALIRLVIPLSHSSQLRACSQDTQLQELLNLPVRLRAAASTPWSSTSRRTVSRLPLMAAQCSGVTVSSLSASAHDRRRSCLNVH